MQVTTSRKPSPKTRRFAKILAGFLAVPYVARGKRRLDTDEVWMVVVEMHGNPEGLIKRSSGEEVTFRFAISSERPIQKLKRRKPKVLGPSDEALPVAQFFDLEWASDAEVPRAIKLSHGAMEFVDRGETIIRLKSYERPR